MLQPPKTMCHAPSAPRNTPAPQTLLHPSQPPKPLVQVPPQHPKKPSAWPHSTLSHALCPRSTPKPCPTCPQHPKTLLQPPKTQLQVPLQHHKPICMAPYHTRPCFWPPRCLKTLFHAPPAPQSAAPGSRTPASHPRPPKRCPSPRHIPPPALSRVPPRETSRRLPARWAELC